MLAVAPALVPMCFKPGHVVQAGVKQIAFDTLQLSNMALNAAANLCLLHEAVYEGVEDKETVYKVNLRQADPQAMKAFEVSHTE